MTNLAVVESLKYGLKLFAYLLAVVVLGGGGMVLGSALAGPELTDGTVTSAELFGGLVLAFLGLAVWVTGTFGIAYKLIADAVQWGVSSGTSSLSVSVPEEFEQQREIDDPASTASIGPSPGEQSAREYGAEPTVPGAASVPDRVVERTSDSGPATEPTAHQQVEDRDRLTTGTGRPSATNEDVEAQEPAGEETDSGDDPLEEPASVEDAQANVPSGGEQPNEHETHEAAEHSPQPRDEQMYDDPSNPPEPTAEEIAFGRNETDEMRTEQTRDRVDELESGSAPADEDEPTAATEGDGSASATGVPESDTGEGTIPTYESVSTSTPLETDEQPFEAQSASSSDEVRGDEPDVETADSRREEEETQAGNGSVESPPDDPQETDDVDFFASARHDQPDETAFEDAADEKNTEETTHSVDAVDTSDEDGAVNEGGTVNDADIGVEDDTEETAERSADDPLSDPLDDDE